jgi:hypothetical protein
MNIHPDDGRLFYKLYSALMFFGNQRFQVLGEPVADAAAYEGLPPQSRMKVRDASGKFPDSEGVRTIPGSLSTAILIGSVIGLIYPIQMSPVLIIQVIYKSLWLLVFALPRLRTGRSGEISHRELR